jgi:hypothetical protein
LLTSASLLPPLASRIRGAFTGAGAPWLLMWAVSLLGFALRLEHALTFDGLAKGSDYAAQIAGLRWMIAHPRPFGFTHDVPWSIGYQPPLWYGLSAAILALTHSERATALTAVAGWALRQWLLVRMLKQSSHGHRWSWLAALTLNAVLPIGVLTDGKVNPEGLHTTLFTVAAYFLWRMERESLEPNGISSRTGVAFGAAAGLAVLTKATAGVLPIAAAVVFGWMAVRARLSQGKRPPWLRLVRPFALAGLAFCLVAGWWCAPNLAKYGHPFPHIWNLDTPREVPILAQPVLQRRPLAWMLPFSWSPHLEWPTIQTIDSPTPNLWAGLVTGTWSDWFNKGFCRLAGPPAYVDHWGGWPVSKPCLRLYRRLLVVGGFLTLAGLLSVGYVAWVHLRTAGRAGSLALPVLSVLTVVFVSLFALVFPYDDAAVLNARYLLPASTPMAACLGMTLARLERGPPPARIARAAIMAAIALVVVLVVYERWGP